MEKQQLIDNYINRVSKAIDCAEAKTTRLPDQVFNLSGMSSRKNRIFLNELITEDTNYLEIGVYLGSTFISALHGNNPQSAIAIDNFSQFSGTLEQFTKNCEDNNLPPYRFINNDCFNLLPEEKESIKNVNVYFYDGDHTEEDQEKALTYYIDSLTDVFIYICDDWNHGPAKIGTFTGIDLLNIKVHKQWELPSNGNGDTQNWWNGLYVAVCEKQ